MTQTLENSERYLGKPRKTSDLALIRRSLWFLSIHWIGALLFSISSILHSKRKNQV